jgi:serine/threonine-protein kinase
MGDRRFLQARNEERRRNPTSRGQLCAEPPERPVSSPLSPDQWQQIESLVDALLDTPPERRAALFAEVSGGDPARRAELERLVAECERAYPLFDKPAAERFAALVDTAPLQPAQVIADRYRITRELGRGGMATVYLAHDLKHTRDVALKVVRSELVATVGSGRFLREIEIAAQMRHPNIVPLYDSGQVSVSQSPDGHEGQSTSLLYYVMPYESGQSLRERLRRDGPLPIDDVVVIVRDVCEALAYAHERGIVHRDIKPDNVLLSGRHALVTDFGVARAASEAKASTASTGAGVMIGTPAYMAPEQVAADPQVDHRVDIYGIGVLAYEILTGVQPLGGDSPQDILAAHLTKTPDPVTAHRPDVPTGLSDLVMKCLEKQAANRWQSAGEVLRVLDEVAIRPAPLRRPAERWAVIGVAVVLVAGMATLGLPLLRRAGSTPNVATEHRLAIGILPSVTAAPAGDLSWLATGLEGQLSMELVNVPEFDIRPNETIAALKGRGWPLDSVATAGNVDYLVRLQLLNATRDSVLVTLDLIERGIRSVRVDVVRQRLPLDITVEALGHRLAERLRPMLGSRARELQLESGSTSAIALQLRRRAEGYRLWARQRVDRGDFRGAESALDSAAALLIESQGKDPKWTAPSLARAGLTQMRAFIVLRESRTYDTATVRKIFDAGVAIVDSVLDRTPRDPIALASRGRLRWQRTLLVEPDKLSLQRADTAIRDLGDALSLDPRLARAAADLSHIYYFTHRYQEAAAYAERAFRIDAYMEESDQIINRLALSNFEIQRDSDAAHWCQEGVRRFPENPAHHGCVLEVMAWGTAPANADSAWAAYRALERLTILSNVGGRAYYGPQMAAVLARSPRVLPDSATALLARIRADVEASPLATQETRELLLAREAAVFYRLGDSKRANQLFGRFRERDPVRASRVAEQRMLRDYVASTPRPATR